MNNVKLPLAVFSLLCGAILSCVDPSTVDCFGNLCPRGTVCVDHLERCVDSDRVQVCTGAGLSDGDSCAAGGQPGVCSDGVCTVGCGDGIMLGEEEVCDGTDFGALSCLDFDFYGGDLACSASCDGIDTGACGGFCGDGTVNGPELCDPELEHRADCNLLGYDRGLSSCDLSCSWPTSGCAMNRMHAVPGLVAPFPLRAIHAYGQADLLMAQGDGGKLLRAIGDRLEVIDTPAVGRLSFWTDSPERIVAVSFKGEAMQRIDGEWTVYDSPAPVLRAIDGLDAQRIWAVGDQDVVHFDGTAWQRVPTPDPDMNPDTPWTNMLHRLLVNEGSNGVQLWVGGFRNDFFGPPPPDEPTLHLYEGGTWTSFPEFKTLTVDGMYAPTADDVYIAFREIFPINDPTPGKLVHFHYDGEQWGHTDVLTGHNFLTIAGTGPNNIYTTTVEPNFYKFLRTLNPYLTQLWHYDGSDWEVIDYDIVSTYRLAMTGSAIYALEANSTEGIPNVRRYDGTSWLERAEGADLGEFCVSTYTPTEPDCGILTKNPFCVPVCEPTSQGYATGAALSASGELVITSNAEDATYTIPFLWSYSVETGYAEIPFPGGSPVPLQDAFTPDFGQTVFAVGDQGVALVRDAGSWTRYDTIGANDLRAVHGRAGNDMFAVGDGTVLHFDGAAWTEAYDAGSTALESVWVAPDGVVFAGGADCTLLTNVGGSWQALSPAPPCQEATSRIVGVHGASANDIWVSDLGPLGSVLRHYNGTAWTARPNLTFGPTPQHTKWFDTSDGMTLFGNGLGALVNGELSDLRQPSPNFSVRAAGITGTDRSIYFVQTDGAVWEMLRLWPWVCDATEAKCSDGMDNDCDGQFDTDDSDCSAP